MSVVFNIDDFDKAEKNKLAKLLTFVPVAPKRFNPNFHFTNQQINSKDIIKMFYLNQKNLHLPFSFACSYYNKHFNIDYDYPRIFEDKKDKFSGKLLPRQIEPFKQALEYLKEYHTVTIALYPGFGKTFMGAMLSWKLNYKTCILVHRENVAVQWVKTFKTYFKIDPSLICLVDDKINIDAKIFICMTRRTDKIPEEIRKQIGVLIIDEAHCFCSVGSVKALLSFTPKYTIAETATPEKENGMFKVIQSICGYHFIQKISTKPYFFFIIQTNLNLPVDSNSKNIFNDLLTEQSNSEVRNKLIVDILENNKHYKTIIATGRVEHCKILKEELSKRNLDSSELYGNKKKYVPKNILIGTCSKMGVGFDEANFCDEFDGRPSDLLMICQTFKTWAPFEQVRGRGMRTDKPNVIMFGDQHSITKRHLTQIKKWVKETNGVIVEINIDDLKSYNLENWKMERLKKKKINK